MSNNQDVTVYQGRLLKLVTKRFTIKGIDIDAEIIRHPGAVVIAATHDDEYFYLVSQLRFAPNETLLEFPAGKLEYGEDPFEAAKRELEEETGFRANVWEDLGSILSAPAFLDERLYLYYATDLEYFGQNLDDDEELTVKKYSINELEDMVSNNTLQDAKTIVLLYKLIKYLKSKEKVL